MNQTPSVFCPHHDWDFLEKGQVHFSIENAYFVSNRLEMIDQDSQVQSLFFNIFYFQPNHLPERFFAI